MDLKNKTFWEDFIDLYRENRCLWDVKSKDYANKMKRNSSYEILFKKFKELFPEASQEVMKKKINNIRTSFRRELQKVEDSKRTGSGIDDIYEPSLWYYDLLLFTRESDTGRKGISNDDDEATNRNIETDKNNWYNEETEESLLSPSTESQTTNAEEEETSQSLLRSRIRTTASVTPKIVSRKRSQPTKSNALEEKKKALFDAAHKYLSEEENVDDESNITGKRFAFQLKKLDDQQRLIAEKLWSDIIFYGAQGKLELDCTIKFPSQNMQQLQYNHKPFNTVPPRASTFILQHDSNQAISHQPDLPLNTTPSDSRFASQQYSNSEISRQRDLPLSTTPSDSIFGSQQYSNSEISRQPDLPRQEVTQSSFDFLKTNLSDFILLKPSHDTNYNNDVS